MSNDRLTLEDLLYEFPVNQLGYALVSAGLPGDGTKNDRVQRLLDVGRQRRVHAVTILELFKAETLRKVCVQFGVQAPNKADMARMLGELLRADEQQLGPTPPLRTTPSFPAVVGYLRRLVLPWRQIRTEADAEQAIEGALRREFAQVATQYSVGGYFGYRIDIDLGNGMIGVEVKLASAIVDSASEAYRTIGQAVIYDRRRYQGRVIVAFAGSGDLRNHPSLQELESLLKDLSITCAYVTLQ